MSKGGATEAIRTAFMRRKLDDWERAEDFATAYTREQVERFSPRSRAILEIQSGRDLEILEKIYANAVLLGDDGPGGWGIRYAREFDMTNDSRLFSPRPQWEAKGYRPDEYSRWLLGDWRPIEELWKELGVDPTQPEPVDIELEEWLFDTTTGPERREAEARFVHRHLLKPGDVARTDWRIRCAQPPYDRLPMPRARIPAGVIFSREADAWIREDRIEEIAVPLYEGRMINFFDWSEKGWIRGRGRRAEWRPVSWGTKHLQPQYLMKNIDALSEIYRKGVKLGFLSIGSGTNVRSFYCTTLPPLPCGNSVGTLSVEADVSSLLDLQRQLSSFYFDYVIRMRLTGLNLNYFVVEENPLRGMTTSGKILSTTSSLTFSSPLFSAERIRLQMSSPCSLAVRHQVGALTEHERIRSRAMLDAVTLAGAGFNESDVKHMMSGCDLSERDERKLNPKGFWRLDKERHPEHRFTVLTVVDFRDLMSLIGMASGDHEKGIGAFVSQNHGEGWMLPETLRLADYGLGHDERVRFPQPVASRLGPRFYDWQLVQSADEAWRECHLHARNLLGSHEYAHLLVEQIECRAADGEDYVGTLTDRFTRELLGDDGYGTVLYEIRSRNVADQDSYWTAVTALRDDGHLADDTYGQLLDKLHARGLLDDIGYLRRRDGIPLRLGRDRQISLASGGRRGRLPSRPSLEEPPSGLFRLGAPGR